MRFSNFGNFCSHRLLVFGPQRLKQLCLSISVLGLATLIAVSLPAAAHADTFDFTTTSATTNGPIVFAGALTTTDTPDANGFYTVTSITDGSENGNPTTLTLLAPGTYGDNDNLVSLTSPYFDHPGLGFNDGTQDYNVFSDGASDLLCVYSEANNCSGGAGDPATVTVTNTTNTSVTPEPSSLILLGTGALGLAAMLRRKKVAFLS